MSVLYGLAVWYLVFIFVCIRGFTVCLFCMVLLYGIFYSFLFVKNFVTATLGRGVIGAENTTSCVII